LNAQEGIDTVLSSAPSATGVEVIDEKDQSLHHKVSAVSLDHSRDSADARSDEVIIVSGRDAAAHLLPMRDDGDEALTFRSLVLASALACFQCVMYQIYMVGELTMSKWRLHLT
jgi:hypothetical protein